MRLLPDNKTTRQLATLRLRQTTRQLVNETTSRAVATCSLVVLWSRSL